MKVLKTFKKVMTVILALVMVICSSVFTVAEDTVVTQAVTQVPIQLVFNVDYTSHSNDIKDGTNKFGQFDATKYLSATLDNAKGYQTLSFNIADVKKVLGEGVSTIKSIGIVSADARYDETIWDFVGWPEGIDTMWVDDISIGSTPVFTASKVENFIFMPFVSMDADWNDVPYYSYANNGVISATEGVDNSSCVKYALTGGAGASWMIYKTPIDISAMADTDKLQLSADIGATNYIDWKPTPVSSVVTAAPAATYEVGPGKTYENIGDVPWDLLAPGDAVYIYWRSTPYNEKFQVTTQGTAEKPIVIHGVPGPNGELPQIDGNNATYKGKIPLENEGRVLVNIGLSDKPSKFVTIENLEIYNANDTQKFVQQGKSTLVNYDKFGAALWVQWGENITVRNCKLHDSSNGLFVDSFSNIIYSEDKSAFDSFVNFSSKNLLVEGNYIYNNGNDGSMFEHNSYCAAIGSIYQFNHYGPLKEGARGYGLKDRGAGTVVRYNWIEGGRRQISLDDAEDCPEIVLDPTYTKAYVYGNMLIEPDGGFRLWGDDEIISFGGDNSAVRDRGLLEFYNNTVVTYRMQKTYNEGNIVKGAAGRDPRTCLLFIPLHYQTVNLKNNIFYAAGDAAMTLMSDNGGEAVSGTINMSHNWFSKGYTNTLDGFAVFNDDNTTISGKNPGFVNLYNKDFRLAKNSVCLDSGVAVEFPPVFTYAKDSKGVVRNNTAGLSIGAYEYGPSMIRRIK